MSKLATNWDALIASTPLNKQAACDANAKGDAHTFRKKLFQAWDVHTDVCPTLRPVTKAMLRSGSFTDLTGQTYGRLTVIGLAAITNQNRREAAWVVRCACGMFEHRRGKTIVAFRKDAERARCGECDHLNEIRSGRSGVEFPKITVRA